MQDLHYGAVELKGPTTYSGPVPDAPPPGAGRRRLIAVTAMRVAAGGTPQVLDPGSAVDLTGRVQRTGRSPGRSRRAGGSCSGSGCARR